MPSLNEMPDDLRTRIAAVLADALAADDSIVKVQYGAGATSHIVVDCNPLADAVIRELTDAIPPVVASAIQGWAQSELAAMSYHGGSKDAFDLMERLNREAMQIAQYATTHEDWNG